MPLPDRSGRHDVTVERPVALVTGASRIAGIGAAISERLAGLGFDVAITFWRPYDERMPWESRPEDVGEIVRRVETYGAKATAVEADLGDISAPATLFDALHPWQPPQVLVLCHCESVDSDITSTTVESFDRHFAVNARASWLLIREFGKRFSGPFGSGRIVSITSDHTVGNLPYGASKAALDRITLAAAQEFAHLGVTANVINPGPTDTGWMTAEQKIAFAAATPLARVGAPSDCARLVAFICSEEGQWVNGQLLFSDGGIA